MPFTFFLSVLILLQFFTHFLAFSLADNGIVGEPIVDCGGNYIEVSFATRNAFVGTVFVEGKFNEPQCRSALVRSDGGRAIGRERAANAAQIRLSFGTCGIKHTKKVYPKGIFLSVRLVVAFHAHYLSKFDRVFDLCCFYMEMEHELEKGFVVNMGPPTMHSKQIMMPICRYEVLSDGPHGPPVYYAKVGQMVYHKWTCEEVDGQQKNQFCMIVHSCFADDGNGDKVQLIDEQGCARDKYLLQNLEYVSDLMVGKEAHVYKYADRQNINFDCKISLRVKEPLCQFCPIPHCPDPPRRKHFNFLSKKRRLRSKRHLAYDYINKNQPAAAGNNSKNAEEGENWLNEKRKTSLKKNSDGIFCTASSLLVITSMASLVLCMLISIIFLTRDIIKQIEAIIIRNDG